MKNWREVMPFPNTVLFAGNRASVDKSKRIPDSEVPKIFSRAQMRFP